MLACIPCVRETFLERCLLAVSVWIGMGVTWEGGLTSLLESMSMDEKRVDLAVMSEATLQYIKNDICLGTRLLIR